MPSGWILGMLLPHTLNPGWMNLLLLFIGAIFWPVVALVGYRVTKEVDTGFYAIISNIAPLVTLLLAVTLLQETLTMRSLTGVFLLIFSGMIVAIPLLMKGTRASRYGVFLGLFVVIPGGIGVAYERWMLTLVGLGTYFIFAWTFQTIWIILLARKELGQIVNFFRSADTRAKYLMITFSVVNVLRTICFQSALFFSGSAAIISAATNFLAVVVLAAAYVVLNEKQYLGYKITAVIVGIIGLFLVAK